MLDFLTIVQINVSKNTQYNTICDTIPMENDIQYIL